MSNQNKFAGDKAKAKSQNPKQDFTTIANKDAQNPITTGSVGGKVCYQNFQNCEKKGLHQHEPLEKKIKGASGGAVQKKDIKRSCVKP